jgi:hypothetical protein
MPFQVSSTAYGSPLTTMQDMRVWLSSLGVFKHTASVAKKAVHGELSLVNAMQRRLYEFLLFFHGVFYEVAGALVLPAFCG